MITIAEAINNRTRKKLKKIEREVKQQDVKKLVNNILNTQEKNLSVRC